LVALQPVQLVSITADPGETENVGFAVRAVTGPAPHPAKIQITGPIASNALLTSVFFPRPLKPFEAVNDWCGDIWVQLSKVSLQSRSVSAPQDSISG
jgi:hypothetical protein